MCDVDSMVAGVWGFWRYPIRVFESRVLSRPGAPQKSFAIRPEPEFDDEHGRGVTVTYERLLESAR